MSKGIYPTSSYGRIFGRGVCSRVSSPRNTRPNERKIYARHAPTRSQMVRILSPTDIFRRFLDYSISIAYNTFFNENMFFPDRKYRT